MIGVFFYLLGNSWKNRTVMRFRRMKQPKYLVGAIVGALYLYFYMFRFVLNPSRFSSRGGGGWNITPENRVLFESMGALALAVICFLAWIFPHERAALVFSEAEVAFLFPAPIRRRALIHFKLLKSQLTILITTLIFTLIFRRSVSGSPWWIRGAGWWLMFSILNLHFLGSSFARTMLLDHGVSNWKRRIISLGLAGISAGALVFWARQTLPPPEAGDFRAFSDVAYYAERVFKSGPLPYVLYPFRLVVRLYLAQDARSFIIALGPALLLLAAHYWWVVRSNVAFQEASMDASRKLAERIATIRANRGGMTFKPKKKKRAPFQLKPTGLPAIGLLWKNLIGAGQAFTMRFWIMLIIMVTALGLSAGVNASTAKLGVALGTVAAMFLMMSFVAGPQFVRQDFRQDLPMADVLKAYPMKGWQVALGELLAPAAILTGLQWLLIVLSVCLSASFAKDNEIGLIMAREWSLAVGLSVAIVAPGLNMVCLLIPNAAVLSFPGWFHTGRDAPQGIEATGQRLIFALGQLVVLVVALVPAGIAFAAVYFVGRIFMGNFAAVPVGSLAAALVLAGEAAAGVMLLGKLFERLDLSAESGS